MDTAGATAYLQADAPPNVRFCQRFGFEVVEQEVIGDPDWFMLRAPRHGQPPVS
jgi:hypothetical protein